MDLIQNIQDSATEHPSDGDATINKKCNSLLAQTTESENSNGTFDCNICFDSACDPVVTLCGHLYCWACIFRWLRVLSSSDSVQHQACPVCKADISQSTLIPLYCHGPLHTQSGVRNPYCDFIPPRPTVCGLQTLLSEENLHSYQRPSSSPHQHYVSTPSSNNTTISSSNLVSNTMAGIINPTIGLLGELVYTRMFGSTDTSLFTNPIPRSYAIVGHNNPRLRRHELQLDKSLNRVSNFLFCCCILCLLLF